MHGEFLLANHRTGRSKVLHILNFNTVSSYFTPFTGGAQPSLANTPAITKSSNMPERFML
jgi:hypothetical protein